MSTTNSPAPSKPITHFDITDFCKNPVLEIEAGRPHGMCPALVSLIYRTGKSPCSFQASLTPDTARHLAAMLMILADTAEQFEIEATIQAELDAEMAQA